MKQNSFAEPHSEPTRPGRSSHILQLLHPPADSYAPCARLNGHPEDRLPGKLLLSFLGCFDHSRFEKALSGLAIFA